MTTAASSPALEIDNGAILREMFEQTSGLALIDAEGDKPFLELGLDSLTLTQLALQVKKTFKVNLTFRQLMEDYRTFDSLGEFVGSSASQATTSAAPKEPRGIQRDPAAAVAPLTSMQERIRFLEDFYPGRAVYNVPASHRIVGPLDFPALKASLREIVRRQSAMRSFIGVDARSGLPAQMVQQAMDVDLPLEDLRSIASVERETVLANRMQALADLPIDVHRAPLFRVALYRLAEQEHALIIVAHHMVWDGWSAEIFMSELSTLYSAFVQGRQNPLAELEVSYSDYARWHDHWLTTPEASEQIDYWKQRYARVEPAPWPTTDFPRKGSSSGKGQTVYLRLSDLASQRLRQTARDHNVTLNMLALAVLSLMMSQAIGSPSVVIATPVRGRDRPEVENIIGFFNNLLLIPLDPKPDLTMGEYLSSVKDELMSALDNQQVPFERLVSEPEFARNAQHGGLYQALFSFQNAYGRARQFAGLVVEEIQLRQGGATDDFGVWLTDLPEGIEGAVTYNSDIYSAETGAAFRDRYLELLEKVASMPNATLASLAQINGSSAAAALGRIHAGNAKPTVENQMPARGPAPEHLLMPEQARLAQVWAGVLGIDVNSIQATDGFFDLGGDSLLAMRAIQLAEQSMGFRIEAKRYVFETLAQLSNEASALPAKTIERVEAPPPSRGLFGRVKSAFGRG